MFIRHLTLFKTSKFGLQNLGQKIFRYPQCSRIIVNQGHQFYLLIQDRLINIFNQSKKWIGNKYQTYFKEIKKNNNESISKSLEIKYDALAFLKEKLIKKDISIEEYIFLVLYLQARKNRSSLYHKIQQIRSQIKFNDDQLNYNLNFQKWYEQHNFDELAKQCIQSITIFSVSNQDNEKVISNIMRQPIVINHQELTYIENTLLPKVRKELQLKKEKISEKKDNVTLLVLNPDYSISTFTSSIS